MRNLAMGSHPLTSMFRELEDSFFSPQKYGRTIIANPGTKDKPTIIKRGDWVVRHYKAWQDEDGSYHEELVHDEDENITNTGGTG